MAAKVPAGLPVEALHRAPSNRLHKCEEVWFKKNPSQWLQASIIFFFLNRQGACCCSNPLFSPPLWGSGSQQWQESIFQSHWFFFYFTFVISFSAGISFFRLSTVCFSSMMQFRTVAGNSGWNASALCLLSLYHVRGTLYPEWDPHRDWLLITK